MSSACYESQCLCLPAWLQVPWDQQFSRPQSVRATNNFFSKPWYDSVEYVGKNGRLQYGQLRGLVRLELNTKKRRRQGAEQEALPENEVQQRCTVALIRKYQKWNTPAAEQVKSASIRQHFVAAGCVHLQWAGTRMQNEVCTVDSQYELIQVEDIVRRVYVVPDYTSLDRDGTPRYFFTNVFKYDRQVKDARTIADKEGNLYNEGILLPQPA